LELNKAFPLPRFFHSCDYDSKTKLFYIFGGFNYEKENLYLCDLNIIKINKNSKSSQFSIENENIKLDIPKRCKHSSFIYNNYLYIFGGEGLQELLNLKGKLRLIFSY